MLKGTGCAGEEVEGRLWSACMKGSAFCGGRVRGTLDGVM